MFKAMEKMFKSVGDFSDSSRALVTVATATGALVLLYYVLKLTLSIFTALRLYVFSQRCRKVDYVKRYGKWAVVSGSTDGIGLAMAKELARRGHSIIVIGRSAEKLANTKLTLKGEPNVGEVETVKIDLSDSSVANYEAILGQLDPDNRDIGILINCAGMAVNKLRRFSHFEMDSLRTLVNVNILATVYLTRMIMPGMIGRGKGLVVNVSSSLGSVTTPYMSIYAPSKTFVSAFSQQLQAEYSSHPIDIINLTTGPVSTKLLSGVTHIPDSSLMFPSPEDYARSAINALAARSNSISGTMTHGFMCKMSIFFESLGLNQYIWKASSAMSGKDFEISPVMKRKNRKQVGQRDVESA